MRFVGEEEAEVGILSAENISDAACRLVDTDVIGSNCDDACDPSIHDMTALDQQCPKNKSLLAVSPFVRQENRFVLPPQDLFVNGIMQIAPGEGFEAAGEPVFYGSNVKLVNMRSGQFLCLRDSNVLELVSPAEMRLLHSKECSFKINPRYTLHSEGEHVAYEDLITLSHFSGKTSTAPVSHVFVMSENSSRKTALRLSPFRSYAPRDDDQPHDVLKAGSIIQFYHKVQKSFLTVDMTYVDKNSNYGEGEGGKEEAGGGGGGGVQNVYHLQPIYEVKAVLRFSTIIDKSCGFWRLETVPTGESGKPYRVDGNIRVGSRIRLRHVLYDKYLLVKREEEVGIVGRVNAVAKARFPPHNTILIWNLSLRILIQVYQHQH